MKTFRPLEEPGPWDGSTAYSAVLMVSPFFSPTAWERTVLPWNTADDAATARLHANGFPYSIGKES